MDTARFQLRHVESACVVGHERGSVTFGSEDAAVAFVMRFVCEPGAFVVEPLDPAAVEAA